MPQSRPTPPLTIDQFYTNAPVTPGMSGFAFLEADHERLPQVWVNYRALQYLNLLSQAKAISTVSGGSWLGVPFEYLPAGGPVDSAFLGTYVANPGSLTLAQLSSLPSGNAASALT